MNTAEIVVIIILIFTLAGLCCVSSYNHRSNICCRINYQD